MRASIGAANLLEGNGRLGGHVRCGRRSIGRARSDRKDPPARTSSRSGFWEDGLKPTRSQKGPEWRRSSVVDPQASRPGADCDLLCWPEG